MYLIYINDKVAIRDESIEFFPHKIWINFLLFQFSDLNSSDSCRILAQIDKSFFFLDFGSGFGLLKIPLLSLNRVSG